MQRVTSISFATVPVDGTRSLGGVTVVAYRRLISSDCIDIEYLPYAFSTFTRNDLNSGVCELPSPTDGVSVFAR